MTKKLYKSKTDRKLTGVCGGVAEYFEIDSTLVRIFTVALVFATNSLVFWLYLLMVAFVPEQDAVAEPVVEPDASKKQTKTAAAAAKDSPLETIVEQVGESAEELVEKAQRSPARLWLALGLVSLGGFLLLRQFLPIAIRLDRVLMAGALIVGGLIILQDSKRKEK